MSLMPFLDSSVRENVDARGSEIYRNYAKGFWAHFSVFRYKDIIVISIVRIRCS